MAIYQSLKGFKQLNPTEVDFKKFHECFDIGGDMIIGGLGACYKIYTKEGYPLTRASHTLTLDDWGHTVLSTLGSSEVEYDFDDLREQAIGLRNMIMALIHKSNSEED